MAYRPPHSKFWYEETRKGTGRFKMERSRKGNNLLYLGSNRGLHSYLEGHKKLDRYLMQRTFKIKSNLASELPRSTSDSRGRGRQTLKSGLDIRRESPGGFKGDRSAFLIIDNTRRGGLRVVDYLSQFTGETLKARRAGKQVGSPVARRLTDRAISKSAL